MASSNGERGGCTDNELLGVLHSDGFYGTRSNKLQTATPNSSAIPIGSRTDAPSQAESLARRMRPNDN